MAVLIAAATAAANSADVTVVAGTPVTVFLNVASGEVPRDARATILMKNAGGQYEAIGSLSGASPETKARVIDGPGTYRVAKGVTSVAVAVDQT